MAPDPRSRWLHATGDRPIPRGLVYVPGQRFIAAVTHRTIEAKSFYHLLVVVFACNRAPVLAFSSAKTGPHATWPSNRNMMEGAVRALGKPNERSDVQLTEPP